VTNILFRADSSSTIGTGHIMRDLVLASKYKDANIIFAVQDLDGNINHKIIEASYKVEILKTNSLEGAILSLPGIVLIGAGSIAAIGGLVFTSVSIGLKSANKEYMELSRPQQPISLQFGIQENGIGARIRF